MQERYQKIKNKLIIAQEKVRRLLPHKSENKQHPQLPDYVEEQFPYIYNLYNAEEHLYLNLPVFILALLPWTFPENQDNGMGLFHAEIPQDYRLHFSNSPDIGVGTSGMTDNLKYAFTLLSKAEALEQNEAFKPDIRRRKNRIVATASQNNIKLPKKIFTAEEVEMYSQFLSFSAATEKETTTEKGVGTKRWYDVFVEHHDLEAMPPQFKEMFLFFINTRAQTLQQYRKIPRSQFNQKKETLAQLALATHVYQMNKIVKVLDSPHVGHPQETELAPLDSTVENNRKGNAMTALLKAHRKKLIAMLHETAAFMYQFYSDPTNVSAFLIQENGHGRKIVTADKILEEMIYLEAKQEGYCQALADTFTNRSQKRTKKQS